MFTATFPVSAVLDEIVHNCQGKVLAHNNCITLTFVNKATNPQFKDKISDLISLRQKSGCFCLPSTPGQSNRYIGFVTLRDTSDNTHFDYFCSFLVLEYFRRQDCLS